MPTEGEIEPLLDLGPSERRGEDLFQLGDPTLTRGVIKPKLPPPRRLPIAKVTPKLPQHPPEIRGGKHVERPPHGPGPNNLPAADGGINVLPSKPVGPNPHSKPIGPNVLPLQGDNPTDRVDNGGSPSTPKPVGSGTSSPKIHATKTKSGP